MGHYDSQFEAQDDELREKKRIQDLAALKTFGAALEEANRSLRALTGPEYDPLRRAFNETAIFAEHAKFRLDRG